MKTICIQNHSPKITSKLNTSLQIKAPLRHFNRRILSISMTKHLICVLRHCFIKCFCNFQIFAISPNTTNHLLRCNLSQIIRNHAQASMSNQNSLFIICIIHTLTKFTIQHSSNLRIQPPSFKLLAGNFLKFCRFRCTAMRPIPEPTFMISFQ